MKPNILKWIYLALGFLILINTIFVVYHPFFIGNYSSFFDPILPTITDTNGDIIDPRTMADRTGAANIGKSFSPLDYPILPAVIVIFSIVSIIGLIKVASWSRVAAYITIGITTIQGIGMHIFFIVATERRNIEDLLNTFIYFDVLLLFLAYKIYLSRSLRNYLSSPPHTAT